MEKLKPFIEFMKKHGFWVLTGIVLVVASVGYYFARSSLTAQIASRSSAVDAAYGSVTAVKGQLSTHPNSHSHKMMDEMVSKVTEDVNKAWAAQYARQENIFVWPEQAVPPESRDQTLAKLNKLRPIELHVPFPVDPKVAILNEQERKVYRDYIESVFPRLASIIGSEWKAVLKAGGGGGMYGMMGGGSGSPYGGGGMSLGSGGDDGDGNAGLLMPSGGGQMPGNMMPNMQKPLVAGNELVLWSAESQQELLGNIISWYNPKIAPETIQICYTQEDLWILQGILEIIAETNAGARENFQAAIKEIDFIRFGKSATAQAGSLSGSGSTGSPYGGMMMGNPMAGMSGGNSPSPYGAAKGKGGAAAAILDPAENRYVDANFKPVPGAKLRTSMKNKSPADAYFAVAKRVPVRMRFERMDQRKLNHFLAVCGSMKMVLEVRQVRINAESAAAGQGGSPYGAGGGASKMAEMGMVGAGGVNDGGSKIKTEKDSIGFDVPVEVYGVIYLYNPVNIEMLGLKDVKADTKLNTSAGPATPAADSPAPAVPAAQNTAGQNSSAQPAANGAANSTPAASTPVPAANPEGSPPAAPVDPSGQGDADDR